MFLSSDVGSPIADLESQFSDAWKFETLGESWWWDGRDEDGVEEPYTEWRPKGTYCAKGEPDGPFAVSTRHDSLSQYLFPLTAFRQLYLTALPPPRARHRPVWPV